MATNYAMAPIALKQKSSPDAGPEGGRGRQLFGPGGGFIRPLKFPEPLPALRPSIGTAFRTAPSGAGRVRTRLATEHGTGYYDISKSAPPAHRRAVRQSRRDRPRAGRDSGLDRTTPRPGRRPGKPG